MGLGCQSTVVKGESAECPGVQEGQCFPALYQEQCGQQEQSDCPHVLGTEKSTPLIMCSGPLSARKTAEVLELVQKKAEKLLKGLELMSQEEMLRELDMASLGKRSLKGGYYTVYNYLRVQQGQGWPLLPGNKCQRMFRLDIRIEFFTGGQTLKQAARRNG